MFRLEFGSNEKLSALWLQDWLKAHPSIAKQIELHIYGESDGDHADLKASQWIMEGHVTGQLKGYWEPLWVSEIKIDADAKKSRNDKHYYNNLAKLRDDYDCPRYVFIIDSGKMETYQHPKTRKWHRQAIFSKSLIGDLMHQAIVMGKCIPRYMKKDRFGDIIWELLNTPIPTVDCGVRYLERAPGSNWEQALQAFDGVNAPNAVIIAERYPTLVRLVLDNIMIVNGVVNFDPNWIELDDVWPPTKENEESKVRVKFIEQIGGSQN